MSTVVETLAEYETYLKYERRIKASTLRKVHLSLKYFTELFWVTETGQLKPSDMYTFYEWLKKRNCMRGKNGQRVPLWNTFVQKVMSHVKTYIKRLGNAGYTNSLYPGDVPHGKVLQKVPSFLTKQEVGKIMRQLEQDVEDAERWGDNYKRYAAYLWRAVTWMLYTTGLRNSELRSLTYDDINIPAMSWMVLWKGDKLWPFTFSEAAQKKLQAYLRLREEYFPDTRFRYLFTMCKNDDSTALIEQTMNNTLKAIAKRAGIDKNVHAHLFRHSLATHLIQDGRNIVDVRDKLRHSNIAITSIYTHSNPDSLRAMTKSLWWDLIMCT